MKSCLLLADPLSLYFSFHFLDSAIRGMASKIAYKLLAGGGRMPIIGLGTYEMAQKEVAAAIDCALTVGYRHIDTAATNHNEAAIGEALQDHLKSGKLKREDLFVTSKLPPSACDSDKDMHMELEKTLEALKLSYLDMYLVHTPWGVELGPDGKAIPTRHNSVERTWRMMEHFYEEGKVKAIGVSNFSIRLIDRVLASARIRPENVQFECHAYYQQKDIREHCEKNNLVMTSYAPLGAPGRPSGITPAHTPELMQDERLLSIAKEIKKTPAQVLLAYLMALDTVPLPKSSRFDRIEENFKATQVELTPAHMKTLRGLDSGVRYFIYHWAKRHYEYIDDEAY